MSTELGPLNEKHQRFVAALDQDALFAFISQFQYLCVSKCGTLSELNTFLLGIVYPVHLSLGPNFRLELADSAEHVKQQATCRIRRINILVKNDKIDPFFS
ncbi:MAG: hypothetical protein OXC62_06245 [Aestuariivita sp.]|nr:hypothetical protein [Aestuariivita sp.]